MPKRPIRLTISMTAEEYDQLCWLALYWGEVPSGLAHNLMEEEIGRRMAASLQLQAYYEAYRQSKIQVVPGPEQRELNDDGATANEELPQSATAITDRSLGRSNVQPARPRRRRPEHLDAGAGRPDSLP